MRPRHWLVAGLVAVNVALLVAGVGMGGERGSGRGKVKIGLVFDVGGLGDKSFNDAANRGLQRAARELPVTVRYIEPGDGSDREGAMRRFAQEGYDLVIGVGWAFSEDVRSLAREFSKIQFACVDYAPPQKGSSPPNIVGLRFREQEGSYLVGAIAGLTTRSRQVGFVGGMKNPLIRKFEIGYTAGVHRVCPDCVVRAAYAGNTPEAFADPTRGKELALAQYDRGVDVIFHAAGKTGDGVIGAARERGRWVIGVDKDQFAMAPCCVLTSMIKKVDVAVFDVIRDVADGQFHGGDRELGLAEDGVGYVYDANNRDRIPPDVRQQVEALRADIIAGRIEVPWQ